MELREAMGQISEIRAQMARGEVFRGYRAAPIGFSGVLAIGAAVCQRWIVPEPARELERFLMLWVAVAGISLLAAGGVMLWRAYATRPGLLRQTTRLAVEQFLPSIVVGGLLTVCVFRAAPEVAWTLPGLWALVFSLGIFASYRLLPRPMLWVGCYYVVAGLVCLIYGQGEQAFAGWQMGVSFGVGQLLCAATLYWNLERNDAEQA